MTREHLSFSTIPKCQILLPWTHFIQMFLLFDFIVVGLFNNMDGWFYGKIDNKMRFKNKIICLSFKSYCILNQSVSLRDIWKKQRSIVYFVLLFLVFRNWFCFIEQWSWYNSKVVYFHTLQLARKWSIIFVREVKSKQGWKGPMVAWLKHIDILSN